MLYTVRGMGSQTLPIWSCSHTFSSRKFSMALLSRRAVLLVVFHTVLNLKGIFIVLSLLIYIVLTCFSVLSITACFRPLKNPSESPEHQGFPPSHSLPCYAFWPKYLLTSKLCSCWQHGQCHHFLLSQLESASLQTMGRSFARCHFLYHFAGSPSLNASACYTGNIFLLSTASSEHFGLLFLKHDPHPHLWCQDLSWAYSKGALSWHQ
jgi:hypothetical protein